LASTPPSNEAFIREVDEELRRDQVKTLWQRYGRLAIVAIVAALIGLGGWLWYQADQAKRSGVEGEQLSAAIQDLGTGNTTAASAKLAPLATSKVEGYRVAAKLAQADLALDKNDIKTAAAAFAAIAADTSLAQPYRDAALIRQTAAEYDTLPPATVVARLRPLAVAGSPWFGSAGEMSAIAYMRMNQPKPAAALLTAMAADEGVPETIRSRAVQLAGVLGIDAVPSNTTATAKQGQTQ